MTDLRAACIHGRYEKHQISQYPWGNMPPVDDLCPGGREVTDSDILTLAADIIETNPRVGAVFDAAKKAAKDNDPDPFDPDPNPELGMLGLG